MRLWALAGASEHVVQQGSIDTDTMPQSCVWPMGAGWGWAAASWEHREQRTHAGPWRRREQCRRSSTMLWLGRRGRRVNGGEAQKEARRDGHLGRHQLGQNGELKDDGGRRRNLESRDCPSVCTGSIALDVGVQGKVRLAPSIHPSKVPPSFPLEQLTWLFFKLESSFFQSSQSSTRRHLSTYSVLGIASTIRCTQHVGGWSVPRARTCVDVDVDIDIYCQLRSAGVGRDWSRLPDPPAGLRVAGIPLSPTRMPK